MTEHATVEVAPLRAALADVALGMMAFEALMTAIAPGDEMSECCLCHRDWDTVGGPVALVVLRPAAGPPGGALLCGDCARLGRDRLVPLLVGLFAELLGDSAEITGFKVVDHPEGRC